MWWIDIESWVEQCLVTLSWDGDCIGNMSGVELQVTGQGWAQFHLHLRHLH